MHPSATRVGMVTAVLVATLAATPRLQESVAQLEVPMAPVRVHVGDVPHLVHELHVTNFRRDPLTLRRLVVGDGADRTLLDLSGVALARALTRVGLARDAGDPLTLDPGRRGVVFVWLPLSPPAMPTQVRHQVEAVAADGRPLAIAIPGTPVSLAPVAEIDPPLSGGPWVAIYDPQLVGGHRTTLLAVGGRARIPGRFAIDWVRAPAEPGVRTPVDAGRGFIGGGFGADVHAVANGVVVDARDGRPDLPPGVRAPAAPMPLADASGNHLVLDIGNGRYAVYEHLQQGSVTVRTGDHVRRGQVIGRLGSSGSTSIGPHLHFHVADAGSTLAAEGQPFVIRRFEQIGSYPSVGALVAGDPWIADARGSGPRLRQHPAPMSVVRF